jgi:hypothetical protein
VTLALQPPQDFRRDVPDWKKNKATNGSTELAEVGLNVGGL